MNIVSNASCTTNCAAPLVKVINDNCIDRDNAFAAQKASTVFEYDKAGMTSYWLTAEEFAALSVKDGVLEGYALNEDADAKLVMRNEATKAATKDNYTAFATAEGQGLVIDPTELYRTELTDEAAKQLGIVYDEENLRAYSANGVDERADAVKTTVGGGISVKQSFRSGKRYFPSCATSRCTYMMAAVEFSFTTNCVGYDSA